MTPSSPLNCPCGSTRPLADCCQPYHQGKLLPATPEALMRSRYSAFALGLTDYLLHSWHASTRPAHLEPDAQTDWKALSILEAPAPASHQGRVHFQAFFRERNRWQVLEETSRFVFEGERWWYLDGTPSIERLKPGRNDPCLCGSGRKIKQCCGV